MARTGFLITGRLKSKRLPMKLLKDLNGSMLIERVIERAKAVKGISDIVLCTSTNSQDSPLLEVARKNGIHCFAGDERDVLKRLLEASEKYSLDYFVGITADNPLMTIDYTDRMVDEFNKNDYDYIKIEGLPLGSASYGMKVKALKTVCLVKTMLNTGMWGELMDRPEIFNIRTICAEGKVNRPELRFTLDYYEDYEMIKEIYTDISPKGILKLEEVIDYLDNNPEVAVMNRHCVQRDLELHEKEQIDREYRERYAEIINIKSQVYSGNI